jgi:hypothetical protein
MIDTVIIRMHGINQQKLKTIDQIRELKETSDILLVPEHFDLYNVLMQFKGKTFTRTDVLNHEELISSVDNQKEFLSSATSKVVNSHFLNLERTRYTDGDYIKETNRKIHGKYRIASSSPDVSFTINPDGGFIDFNVSIPKYLFMHNLAQFVPQIDSKNFKLLDGNFYEWSTQRHYLHKRLMSFIKRFFVDMYGYFDLDGLLPNYDYIEIRRIDLCFNQIFDSKNDALLYLEHQKKLHKKSKIRYKAVDKDHHTSIAYHTAKHEYFKIYHKGSEYKSVKYGDFSKHHKINMMVAKHHMKLKEKRLNDQHYELTKDKNYMFNLFQDKKALIFKKFEYDAKGVDFSLSHLIKQDLKDYHNVNLREQLQDVFNEVYRVMPINTEFIANEADKILRYEISISGYSFNHLYKKYIFRKDCKIHKHYKEIYAKVKRVDARKDGYKYKITPQDRRDYTMMHDFYNRTSNFTLTKNQQIVRHAKKGDLDYIKELDSYSIQKSYWFFGLKSVLENHDVFFFSEAFLKKLVDKFKAQIDYYQLKYLKPYEDLHRKVNEFNLLVDNKVKNYNKLNAFKTLDINKKPIIHKGKIVKNAVQLLTESEKRKKGMQRINIANISLIFKLLTDEKNAMSFSQIRDHLQMSKDAFYRRKRSLQSLGIYENSLSVVKKLDVPIDFANYYHKTKALHYKKDFFFKERFSAFG